MELDEKSLRALEVLMNEFFSSSTTNSRKREIEELLNNFSSQQESWKHCLAFLVNSSNEYVMMYCLTVIENFINFKWLIMAGSDRGHIRITLYTFMLSHHQKVPNFICNKLGKLIVDIGRIDWPHFYPDFFHNIFHLAQSTETAPIGLMLIQTAFEELITPREDLTASRKDELHRLLLEQIPTVLNMLCGHLDSVLEKHCNLVTATPPPSPTHCPEGEQASLFSTSPLHTGSLLSGMFKSLKKSSFHCIPTLDPESHHLCFLSLKSLTQLLGWMPLSSFITSSMLTTIFHFASFGCNFRIVTHSRHTVDNADLGIQAMSCINEIMSRNCIPTDFEEFLLQMFRDTFNLLQHLTSDNNNTKPSICSNNLLADVDERFIEKFTEFLGLFVSLHFKRFEDNPNFPVLEFLALLFKYTFQQPSHDGFFSCLDIWSTFLDYLSAKLKKNKDNSTTLMRYKDALVALVQEILRKFQFRYNQSSLEELDDEDLDDDSKTEWQYFLQQCLEITSRICELMPTEVFKLVYALFEENLQVYLNLENFVKTMESSEKTHLFITGENECRRLHCSLRDLSSTLQAVGCLVEQMCGENFAEKKVIAQKTLERLCHSANYSNRLRFYEIKTAAPLVLKSDFTEVHAQILATLKSFCHWLTQYSREIAISQEQNMCTSIECAIAEIVVPNITKMVPVKVAHSASHLLLSLTSTVRPTLLFQQPCIQKLFSILYEGEMQSLPFDTQLVIYRSMSNMLIIPWLNVLDVHQEWTSRSSQHNALIHALSSPLKLAFSNCSFMLDKIMQSQAKPSIVWVLRVISDLIENISESPTKTKQLFYQSIQPAVQMIETLLHIYLYDADVTGSILDFFLCLFTVLKSQTGVAYVEQIMQNFLNLFTTDQLVQCILNEGKSGSKVVKKLLQLFQSIIEEPISNCKDYLPNTVNLCMNQIYPIVAQSSSVEVKPVFFDLMYSILLHNWRYFFKTPIIVSYCSSMEETLENEQVFIKIMEAFGHSFLQPDIALFRQNLSSLENLNNKWKLYHKTFFKTVMLNQFLNVLLQSLVHRSHNLLQDEIIATIYNMASVDFSYYFSTFIPQFLQSSENLDTNQKSTLLQNFQAEVDLPSFTLNTRRFVSDVRYYCICNSSIP